MQAFSDLQHRCVSLAETARLESDVLHIPHSVWSLPSLLRNRPRLQALSRMVTTVTERVVNFQHLHSGPLAEEHCDRWIHQAICNQPRLGWLRGLFAPMSGCQAARHVPREFRACAADPLCTELCTRRSLLPRTPLTS